MKFLLVCEGPGDEEDLRAMTWSALRYAHDWLEDSDRIEDAHHAWIEFDRGARFLRWSDIDKVCDQRGIPPVQRLGRPLHHRATRRMPNVLATLAPSALEEGARVVIAHDSDGVDGVFESISSARDEWLTEHRVTLSASDIDVAVGVAHPEHEAWAIALFEARDEGERARLEGLRSGLGFDPTRYPERLTSGRPTHPKDAKRVLRELVGGDSERGAALLRDAPVDGMVSRGADCGLSDFVLELVTRIASASGAVPRDRIERLSDPLDVRRLR